MLPIKNEEKNIMDNEIDFSKIFISNLVQEFFTGKDEEILNGLLSNLALQNVGELVDTFNLQLSKHVDMENLQMSDIEELDFIGIIKNIAGSLNYNPSFQPLKKESKKFEATLKEFTHAALHDVAFPIMVMENPNVAVTTKNVLKRVIASMQEEENIDMSEVYQTLDIENLPVTPSVDLLLRLGGNIPGLEPKVLTEIKIKEDEEYSILICELSSEQAVYLAYILEEDYCVIKDWRKFYNLLKSNGTKYESVIVASDKKGILFSILKMLYNTKNFTQVRYLHTDKGNEMWPFFERFLIDSRTDEVFQSDLRKIPCKEEHIQLAKEIVDHLLDSNNHHNISQTAKENFKKF